MMDEAECGAAPGVHRSGQEACPRGERLEASGSTVWSGYSARERMWGSGSLGQGSKEHVTSWSVTTNVHKLPVPKGTCKWGTAYQCRLSNSCNLYVYVHCSILYCCCEAQCALLPELELRALSHNTELVMQCEVQNSKSIVLELRYMKDAGQVAGT
jgi:hypothetical protein